MDRYPRLERVLRPVEGLAGVALSVLMGLVFVSVMMRFFLNSPIKDSFDLSRMFLGIAVFWGIAAACARDEYVRGDVFWDRLPPPARSLVDWFGRLVILVAMAVLLWQLLGKTLDVQRSGELTSELRIVIWPFYAVMSMGASVAGIGVAARLVSVVRKGVRVPAPVLPEHPEETAL